MLLSLTKIIIDNHYLLAVMGLLTINILMLYINLRLYQIKQILSKVSIDDIAIDRYNRLGEYVKTPDLLLIVQPFRGVEDK